MGWLEDLARGLAGDRPPYFDDPVGWVQEYVLFPPGQGLTPYQAEILSAVPRHHQVAARGPRGAGKTAPAALAVHWFALTREAAGVDWKIGTVAPSWRQLEFLWREVKKWSKRIDWDKLGRPPYKADSNAPELMKFGIQLEYGNAFANATDDAETVEGAHGDEVLYILDEAKRIDQGVFDALEGIFSGSGEGMSQQGYRLMLSTPGSPIGRFYEVHARRPGFEDWWVRHVTLPEAIASGRLTEAWAEKMRKQWGEQSALYQQQVLANFANDDQEGVLPLSWVEAAVERWYDWKRSGEDPGPLTHVGADVGETHDRSVVALRHGRIITELQTLPRGETMETAGRIAAVLNTNRNAICRPDAIGIGAGVGSRLAEQGYRVEPFNASRRTDQVDLPEQHTFFNMRAAGWWTLRELLDPANAGLFQGGILLPPHDELIGELTAPRWRVLSGAVIKVESKDDIRRRIGRSTDHADAVMQAFAMVPQEDYEGVLYLDDPVSISPY